MRRKTFSPAFITAILLAVTAAIFALAFYLQGSNVRALYGSGIREAVYEVNDLTGRTEEVLASRELAPVLRLAARLDALSAAGVLHPAVEAERAALVRALDAYADGLEQGGLSENALKLLEEDALSANRRLRILVQHAIARLGDDNAKRMDRNFTRAMRQNSRVYKELTLLAAQF